MLAIILATVPATVVAMMVAEAVAVVPEVVCLTCRELTSRNCSALAESLDAMMVVAIPAMKFVIACPATTLASAKLDAS